MSYPPKIFQESNKRRLVKVIKTYPLATLISVKDQEPVITHVPLILEGENTLVGHLNKLNPQVELLKDNQPVSIIFSGPQCYISPSIYTTEQLPTWNYIFVHLKGEVVQLKDPIAVRDSLIQMTRFLEQPNNTYILHEDNPMMKQYLPLIHGFKIKVSHWEGKFKLSQNRDTKDFKLAKAAMLKKTQTSIEAFLSNLI